ncbi:MAG: GLUG motif-containing protein, partial [Candidatus Marinimicrobia bacterium]|nr:GLUG motif-containing protein [Candidatus Neomarinimicrobiota bacterium]
MLKKSLILGIVLSICVGFLFAQTAVAPSAGDGSEGNPYQIATLANLRWLSENSDKWASGICFIQTADIDASETQYWNDGVGFSPIGNSDTKFEGNYNGSGHTISGLFINRPDESYIGLFGYTSGSEIKNLGISDVNITCNESSGSLVGYNSSSSIIKCYSKGNISGKGSFVGGLVGSNSNSTISGSYSTGNVTSESFTIGGLIGYNSNFSNIEYCFSSCNVTGRSTIGGLIGSNNSSTVNNSYSFGNATGKRTV